MPCTQQICNCISRAKRLEIQAALLDASQVVINEQQELIDEKVEEIVRLHVANRSLLDEITGLRSHIKELQP